MLFQGSHVYMLESIFPNLLKGHRLTKSDNFNDWQFEWKKKYLVETYHKNNIIIKYSKIIKYSRIRDLHLWEYSLN